MAEVTSPTPPLDPPNGPPPSPALVGGIAIHNVLHAFHLGHLYNIAPLRDQALEFLRSTEVPGTGLGGLGGLLWLLFSSFLAASGEGV